MSKSQATIYRMVTNKHICPFGIKAKDLLRRKDYSIKDIHLKNRQEIDDFKAKYNVKTTPQIFIDENKIGGYDDLLKFFNLAKDKKEKSYNPILAVFAMTFLLALAYSYSILGNIFDLLVIKLFMGLSISFLATLKLQNLDSFSNQFITYDLLAMKYVRYSYIYPFAEAFVGICIVASIFSYLAAIIAIIIGLIGAISVFYVVYIQKRDLKCACVGGDSNVPLGFLSLTENIMMIAMGIWMLFL
ncbi:MauE/DoxX family redox-associated membrane protein [Francisella philomiragia]|uniref:Methylamine utilization protein MauE n=1 Tax=Francisella philomiragia TaxID=28110 RepID=A0A0B6CRH9_9GAMM|nr:MauE/DoxX family redox-associated membrane protein [Francisella philomiragia]AJI53084.1 methylamine utilization MauE family protein [Francisella philomiragia]